MPGKLIYEFAVIRLVPKVEREEFINIGVILLCQKRNFLRMKFLINKEKFAVFATEVNGDQIESYLSAWDSICVGGLEGGEIGRLELQIRFRWLTANKSTILQCSEVHAGLCSDPAAELESIFLKHVL
jgi:hypothetical protein